jgi:hypothetical protein
MIDGVLRVLVVAVGLLLIWWLCGPAAQGDRPGRPGGPGPRAGRGTMPKRAMPG